MSYLGNSPQISVARTVTDKTVTELTQSLFGSLGGYTPGMVDVYINGVLLSDEDYTATDGSTILLTEPAVLGDKLRVISFIPNVDINTGYVKRGGDTMANYASITGIGNVGANTVTLNYTQQSSNTQFATSNTQVSVDSFDTTQYRTAKYVIQAVNASEVHCAEVLVTHNVTHVIMTEYATLYTSTPLIEITSTIESDIVYLKVTPNDANTTIDISRNSIIARNDTFSFTGDLNTLSGVEDLQTGSGSVDLL